MLVVVFSIFSESEDSYQEKYVLMRVDWDFTQLKGMSDDDLRASLKQVVLLAEDAIRFQIGPDEVAFIESIRANRMPSGVYRVNSESLEMADGSTFLLSVPAAVASVFLRTREGDMLLQGRSEYVIDLN
ncbi:hypothetical protein LOC67_09170 [Stieleria sp. JC731]|uniref:hypothetical protein n=1 Tax=Pirellulaceae TaxID=2691357 RepID=UPI001E40FF10|nr:hypothetical protein [Stieleria sp. JC731]MCC9600733.1 hypothetical protein [Stieleria sp. JC731]